MSRKTTKITSALNSLNKSDIYSLMLFTLYKLDNNPKYSTLCELCYILDGKNLSKFLQYFGGMTIQVPTLQDMRKMTQTLLLYQYVNVEGGDFSSALKVVCENEFSEEEIKSIYTQLLEILNNYDFKKD